MRLCVVGIGNRWASDDGVGPEVVHRLQAEVPPDCPVTFATLPQADPALLELMGRCDRLILVDAVVSGAPPGTVHRERWRSGLLGERGVERASSHGLGLREVLELAATLGRLPVQVELWGVEIVSTAPGEGLSPAVAAALPAIVAQLRQELEEA